MVLPSSRTADFGRDRLIPHILSPDVRQSAIDEAVDGPTLRLDVVPVYSEYKK